MGLKEVTEELKTKQSWKTQDRLSPQGSQSSGTEPLSKLWRTAGCLRPLECCRDRLNIVDTKRAKRWIPLCLLELESAAVAWERRRSKGS